MAVLNAKFLKSVVQKKQYPDPKDIEFAFIGRSNVGKSSLINSLVERKNLARTSKTPGRTQLINFFEVNDNMYFVDLPGYGFAKVPGDVKKNWKNIIEQYLKSERNKIVFILLDIRRIPSDEDMQMLFWLDDMDIDFYIIFTKVDKLSNNERFKQLKEIRKKIEFNDEDVFYYSSLKSIGKKELETFIINRR